MKKEDYNFFNKLKIEQKIEFDEEQKKVILDDSQNCLVIAGAGCGKTTVISAKVKYLIDVKKVSPSDILVISFTNESVNDIKKQICGNLNISIAIKTFHKLGMEIIKNKDNFKIQNNLEIVLNNYFSRDIYFSSNYLNFLTFYYQFICNSNLKKFYIDNIIVGSVEEVAIVNFLKLARIKFEYKPINFNNIISKFVFYKDGQKFIIVYSKGKKLKYSNCNSKYIYLFKDTDILAILYKELFKLGYVDFFSYEIEDINYNKFLQLCCSFINNYKVNYVDINFLHTLKVKYVSDTRIILFLNVITEAYRFYTNYNINNHIIDFNDMINNSIDVIQNSNPLKYSYVFIDEFQDISSNRLKIIEILSRQKVKITAFGDDWQAIFGFAGSNVNLFVNFPKIIKNCTTLYISKTYRNSQELIDIACSFIMNNRIQIRKNLKSSKKINDPIIVYLYDQQSKSDIVLSIIEKIIMDNKNSRILLLGRYNFDIKEIIDNKNFTIKNNKIICLKNSANLTFLTAHASKGMTYDDTILLNAYDGIHGFPSKVVDDYEIAILKEKEKYFYEEERRLFYVALTRTKNRNYLIVPIDKPSIFVMELFRYDNVKFINLTKKKMKNNFKICNKCGYFSYKKRKSCPYCKK